MASPPPEGSGDAFAQRRLVTTDRVATIAISWRGARAAVYEVSMHSESRFQLEVRETVVHVEGSVDAATAPALDDAIEKARLNGIPVVVDLSAVDFMDSSGLSVLVAANGSNGATALVLRRPSRAVRRVLEITGLEEPFEIE